MTTEELLELVLDHRLGNLHTAMPGRVESYDAAAQTCDVLPQLKRQVPDGEGGYTTEALPVLSGVPVCFPRGGSFFLSFPLAKGDFVLVVFSERATGNWRQKGEASNPGDLRTHSLAGAVAIPGVYPTSGALDDADGTNLVLGKDGSTAAKIEITPSLVKLGGGDQFVALANLVDSRLSAIRTFINAHQHVETGGTTNTTTPALAAQLSVAATNVKAT